MQDNIYNCSDADLGKMLNRLFTEQPEADEIEIQHPTQGAKVITRKEFYATVSELEKARKMNPAQKMMKRKQNDRLKANLQMRFRTALLGARTVEIDVESGKFGYDMDGNELPVEGFIFVHANKYPRGTETHANELGAFVLESWEKPPIRIIGSSVPPAEGVASNVSS